MGWPHRFNEWLLPFQRDPRRSVHFHAHAGTAPEKQCSSPGSTQRRLLGVCLPETGVGRAAATQGFLRSSAWCLRKPQLPPRRGMLGARRCPNQGH